MISVDQVKPFMLHNEGPVREFAVKYFAQGNIEGFDKTEIMPLVLQGCAQYPEQEDSNHLVLSYAKRLPQIPDTIAEILEILEENWKSQNWYEYLREKHKL